MRVSQRIDYTLRLLAALARQPAEEYVAVGELAEALRLPRRFSEQQITELAREGLVECRRGAAGGCRLARPSGSINVAEVVRALQGEILDVPKTAQSATAEMWADLAGEIGRSLSGVTIADLAARQKELDLARSPMYFI